MHILTKMLLIVLRESYLLLSLVPNFKIYVNTLINTLLAAAFKCVEVDLHLQNGSHQAFQSEFLRHRLLMVERTIIDGDDIKPSNRRHIVPT